MRILYITKLKNTMANGVTVAVTQLLSSICNYAEIGWLDLGNVDIEVDPKVKHLQSNDWETFNADIAVFEDPFNTLEFCRIAKALRKRNVPYVLTPHGCFTRVALQKKAIKKYIAIETVFRKYLKDCAATQFLCKNEQDNSLHYNWSLVIPNGIPDSNCFRPRTHVRQIVFLSRKDIRHKGIDYLLEAIRIDQDFIRESKASIALYGSVESDKDEQYIRDYISTHHLEDIVSNNGPAFGNDKREILNRADAFVLTSRHEGFPMSILEALSYGLPVLITRGTNLDGIVNEVHAGWTCESNAEDVACMLHEAIACDNCASYSKNARELSLRYSWEEVSKMTIGEYQKIVNGRA